MHAPQSYGSSLGHRTLIWVRRQLGKFSEKIKEIETRGVNFERFRGASGAR
jgi:hypothetical protein